MKFSPCQHLMHLFSYFAYSFNVLFTFLYYFQYTSGKRIIVLIELTIYCCCIPGITQEEIDDKRLETERKMLEDLKKVAQAGGNLEFRDKNRATPVWHCFINREILIYFYLFIYFYIFFSVRLFVGFASSFGFFIPSTTANDIRLRRIFSPRSYPLHLFFYLNS